MKLTQQLQQLFPEFTTYKQLELELYKEDKQFIIKRLLSVPELKNHFFSEISGVFVFDAQKLMDFIRQKEVFASSYTKYLNKITLTSGGKSIAKELGHVALNFPFKECVLEGGMSTEDKKRSEIFYNATLAPEEITRLFEPKVLTNFKSYGNRTGKINHEKDNLLIKGNNLLALHSLLPKYRGKVKLIYIDPPYNTGNDGFKYNDAFNHSTWLVFMKNRLEVAKTLLADDGVIFVQIDDNEQAYLKVLMDEVFGREGFVNTVIMKTINPNGIKTTHANKTILKVKEQIIVFKKKNIELNPQYKINDVYDEYYNLYIEGNLSDLAKCKVVKLKDKLANLDLKIDLKNNEFKEFIINNAERIFQTKFDKRIQDNPEYADGNLYQYKENDNYYVYQKRFGLKLSQTLKEIYGKLELGVLLGDVWDDFKLNNLYLEGDIDFSNAKKPEALLERIIQIATNEGDLILDFFAGSGTTPAVAHKMGRRWIAIEQMDYIETITAVRLEKVLEGEQGGVSKNHNWTGGGSFCYLELFEWNKKFADLIDGASSSENLVLVYKNIKEQVIWRYDLDIEDVEFKALTLEEQKKLLVETLNKNHLYCNIGEIEDATYGVSALDLELNKDFYGNVI